MTALDKDNILSANGDPPFVRLDVELARSTHTLVVTACIVQDGHKGLNLLKDYQYIAVDRAMCDIRSALEGTYCKLVVFTGVTE